MKRRELLEQNLTEEKNVKLSIENALEEDKRFLKREKRNLEDSIEDLEVELKKRLSSKTPLDKSTIEVTYRALTEKKEVLELYNQFQESYLG